MLNKEVDEMSNNSAVVKLNAEELSALLGKLQELAVRFTVLSDAGAY